VSDNTQKKESKYDKYNINKKFWSLTAKTNFLLAAAVCLGIILAVGIIFLSAIGAINDLKEKMKLEADIEAGREAKTFVAQRAAERASVLKNIDVSDQEKLDSVVNSFNTGEFGFTFVLGVNAEEEAATKGRFISGGDEAKAYSVKAFVDHYKKNTQSSVSAAFWNFKNDSAGETYLCLAFGRVEGTDLLLVTCVTRDEAYANFKVTSVFDSLVKGSLNSVTTTIIVVVILFAIITFALAFAAVQLIVKKAHESISAPLFDLCFDTKKTLEDMNGADIEIRKDTEDEIEVLKDVFEKVTASLRTHIQDVMQLSGLTEKFENSANFDMLTGVFNRRRFFELVQPHAVIAAKKNAPTFVIMVDLDHFKLVNDTYGHAAGDEVLKTVAGKIKDAVRPSDLFGRYGGEEFVMFISVSDVANAKGFADRIRGIIESAPVRFEDIDIPVTASMGLAQAAPDISFEDALKYSDEALYRAKENGRNRVEIYTPETALTEEEKALHGEKKKNK